MFWIYLILTYMFFAVFNELILVPILFKYLPEEFTNTYRKKEIQFGAFLLSFIFEILMVVGFIINLLKTVRKIFKNNP